MYKSNDEQFKRVLYYHESNNNKNNNIENDDSLSRYNICKVCCLKKPHNEPLTITSIAWSFRENIRPRSLMYGPRSDNFP